MNPRHIRINVYQESTALELEYKINLILESAEHDITSINFLDKNDDGYIAIISYDTSRGKEGRPIKQQ